MRQLGTNAYRLTVAWPRVAPDGHGPINAQARTVSARRAQADPNSPRTTAS